MTSIENMNRILAAAALGLALACRSPLTPINSGQDYCNAKS